MTTQPGEATRSSTSTAEEERDSGPTALDDRSLAVPFFSKICTYCKWWKPEDRQHCAAYPKDGPAIPAVIWNATTPTKANAYGHTLAFRGDHGKTFVPSPGVVRTKTNAALLDAYAKAHGSTNNE